MPRPPRLLYFAPFATGGLADYARHQAAALAARGIAVDFLTTRDFSPAADQGFTVSAELAAAPQGRRSPFRRLAQARTLVAGYRTLARRIARDRHGQVLFGAYAEYLAPLWASRLRGLARKGVVFGAVVHDPVRDFQLGPAWWHRWSIASAYSFLREAFVHDSVALDTGLPASPRITLIPHGPYRFPPAATGRQLTRDRLQVPTSAEVWLSFGHLRDGKNLDLVIRALQEFPDTVLIVAGREQSSGQKNAAHYQALARECGVADRCRWLNRFIPPEEVGDLFAAADLVLLAYSRAFRSASGVLNTAAFFRKPCLASGEGNLSSLVETYRLGRSIEPDSLAAIVDGVRRWRAAPSSPEWDRYAREHSWACNAARVAQALFEPSPREAAMTRPVA